VFFVGEPENYGSGRWIFLKKKWQKCLEMSRKMCNFAPETMEKQENSTLKIEK